jgi:TP53 regulating kinase-like protein
VVSFDASRLVGWVRGLELVKRGAESEIRLGKFMGLEAIFKLRIPKAYMDPLLDLELRSARTRREAKAIAAAVKSGVRAPRLYAVFPSAGLIVMEYVRGVLLRDHVGIAPDPSRALKASGALLARLHKAGIVHGDPTTSNYIVAGGGEVYLIDYGLATFSASVEDRAVDLHLFRRALESTHAPVAARAYEDFIEGYRSVMGGESREVEERAEEIRKRGRYVEERRTVWGQLR